MEYKNNSKCEDNKIIDLDSHMKILSFLIHLQSLGIITEEQRDYYSNYIQEYLKQRESNIKFLENVLKEINK